MDTIKKPRAEAHAELAPLLTDEFLATLLLAARILGLSSDPWEVMSFVQECYDVAEKPSPSRSDFAPLYHLYDEDEDD